MTAPAALPASPASSPRLVVTRDVGDDDDDEVERATLTLLDAEGRPSLEALTELSILARAPGVDRPGDAVIAAHHDDLLTVAPDVPRLHPALILRLARIAERFPDHPLRIVSGMRRGERTSRHAHARALDVVLEGVSLDALDAFAQTLERTGVGRGRDHVHLDVRARSLHWVDVAP